MDQAVKCDGCRSETDLFPLTMAFQPIVDVVERQTVGHEALVRGIGGEGAGFVLDQVTEANRYRFDQACRVKAIELAARLGLACRLNINFLPNAVYEPSACIRTTLMAARRTGFPLNRLTFEIVENEAVADEAHLLRIIEAYRQQGFRVALDDFGTGYSGLARLAILRPDAVKLDRSLVAGCDTNRVKLAIVASILALGREIGTTVVVEGVEREAELDAVREAGARLVQGYYFGRPRFEGLVGEEEIWGHAAVRPAA